jgi:hypothetical protein
VKKAAGMVTPSVRPRHAPAAFGRGAVADVDPGRSAKTMTPAEGSGGCPTKGRGVAACVGDHLWDGQQWDLVGGASRPIVLEGTTQRPPATTDNKTRAVTTAEAARVITRHLDELTAPEVRYAIRLFKMARYQAGSMKKRPCTKR